MRTVLKMYVRNEANENEFWRALNSAIDVLGGVESIRVPPDLFSKLRKKESTFGDVAYVLNQEYVGEVFGAKIFLGEESTVFFHTFSESPVDACYKYSSVRRHIHSYEDWGIDETIKPEGHELEVPDIGSEWDRLLYALNFVEKKGHIVSEIVIPTDFYAYVRRLGSATVDFYFEKNQLDEGIMGKLKLGGCNSKEITLRVFLDSNGKRCNTSHIVLRTGESKFHFTLKELWAYDEWHSIKEPFEFSVADKFCV